MKILVTGGAGYIGSHIVLSLCENGEDVVVLDDLSSGTQNAIDDRAKFILGSTLNKKDTDTALDGVDVVIHLAAFKAAGESMLYPTKYSQNNIVGTINLINSPPVYPDPPTIPTVFIFLYLYYDKLFLH